MSTILKALKRLEEDRPPASHKDSTNARNDTSPASTSSSVAARLPATDPGAADQLRARILAEEAAARVGGSADSDPDRLFSSLFSPIAPLVARLARNKMAIATSLVLVLAIGLIGYSLSGDQAVVVAASEPRPLIVSRSAADPAATPAPAPAANVAVADAGFASTPTPSEAASAPRPARAARAIPLAAVAPTRSSAAADPRPKREGTEPIEASEQVALHAPTAKPRSAKATSPRPAAAAAPTAAAPRPRSSASERAPAVVSARISEPVSEAGKTRVAMGSSRSPTDSNSRRSAPIATTREAKEVIVEVARIDHRGLPDVSVVRTSWHPSADNRSARIRLEASKEILNLHEGDAVGGLIVKEISPSSVLFEAGDVEIRRRVGQSSGD